MKDKRLDIEAARRRRRADVKELLERKGRISDDDFLELCFTVRDEYAILSAEGALDKETKHIGAYLSFVKMALDDIEAHYRILETRARTKTLGETQREFVSMTREKREEARKRILRQASTLRAVS